MSSTLYVDSLIEKTSGNGVHIPGHVIQVVQALVTGTATYRNSNSASDISGLTVTITPKSASNKILLLCNISYSTSNDGCGNHIRLKRNGTYIARGTGGASTSDGWFGLDNNYGQANSGGILHSASGSWVDFPSTTSSVTYQVDHFGVGGTTPIKLNLNNGNSLSGVSSLIVMEIAQ